MGFIHYLTKRIIHFCLHVFWIFPVKKNRITLLNELSYKYGDNLKYLNEYIKKNCKNKYEVIFPLLERCEAENDSLLFVKPFTVKYFRYLLTSSVLITNAGGISYLPIRKNQYMAWRRSI